MTPLTREDVHYGGPCDCAEAWRRIERREQERRSEDRGDDRRVA